MNRKDTASPIDAFLLEGKYYEHNIFCSDDDRVECTDEDGKVIMTFTANCDVLDTNKKSIGRWHMGDEHKWYFETHGGQRFDYGTNLLKAEVEISKLYIQGKIHG